LDYIDKDKSNRDLSNLRTLCYNCFFILNTKEKTNVQTPKSPDNLGWTIKKMKTWEEKGKDNDNE
jgi:hypothetical protein